MLGSDRPQFYPRPATPVDKSVILTPEQAQAVRQFVARVGGFENARRALDMLGLLGGK